jgi:hypothetical protein
VNAGDGGPLLESVSMANLDLIKLLLDSGAKVNVGLKYGGPLLFAMKRGSNRATSAERATIMELLVNRGASTNIRFSYPPFTTASQEYSFCELLQSNWSNDFQIDKEFARQLFQCK